MRVELLQENGLVGPRFLADPRLAELAGWGRRLATAGLSPGTSGNLSCRTSGGFAITRTGVALDSILPADWVEITGLTRIEGGGLIVKWRGDHEPSRDAALHAAVYERQGAAGAIFHLHAGRLDELRRTFDIPATEQKFAAGTTGSVAEVERLLDVHPRARMLILVDHGIVAWGSGTGEVGALIEERVPAGLQE